MWQKENWAKVKEIFGDVLDQPEELRADFLRAACGANAELFREVESLLDASQESKPLLEDNKYNLASLLPSAADDKKYDEKTFGHYKIVREIGRGGMGTVFLAQRDDGEFRQQTALKIVRQTIVDSELERRFKRERQILASLNHPHIANLLDGGVSAEGEPFLVMEYVEGEPLINFAESQNLTVEARLDLFIKICSAVSYAHRNLVIHRDIKPSNILVTKDGEPKLLDFGLAKFLDTEVFGQDAAQTATQLRAFTLAYASPEQIRGGYVTTASDVYSLSVVLYELLTGVRPFHFENKSLDEILKTVGNHPPPKPSDVSRDQLETRAQKNETTGNINEAEAIVRNRINAKLLVGDLDNICLMGLRTEPERRYQSVGDLTEDIKRHLKGLPVLARPQTFRYQASKFFKRNKVAVVASILVVLSLLSGLAVSLWEANVARQQRDRAENRFNDVRKLSNSLLFEISPKIEHLQGTTEVREILVKRALEYLDNLAQESSDDPHLQNELAAAYEKVGDLQGKPQRPNLSDFKGAIASYEKSQSMRKKLLEKNPDDLELRRDLAANIKSLADVQWWTNDIQDSLKGYQQALGIYEELVLQNPGSLELKLTYCDTLIDLGQVYTENNRFSEARPFQQKALDQLEALRLKNLDNTEVSRLLGKGYTQLANGLSWDSKQPEAETEMDKALAINESLAKNFPNDPVIRHGLWTNYMVASSIYEEVNNELSNNFALKSLNTAEEMVEKDKANIQARQNLAKSYSRLGITLSNIKKSNEGIAYLEKAKPLYSELEKNEPKNMTYKTDLARLYTRLGDAKYKLGNLRESLADWEKSAELFEQVFNYDQESTVSQRDLAQSCKNIAIIYERLAQKPNEQNAQNDGVKAIENYRKAFDILTQLKAKNAFAEFDQPFFEEMKAAVGKFSKTDK